MYELMIVLMGYTIVITICMIAMYIELTNTYKRKIEWLKDDRDTLLKMMYQSQDVEEGVQEWERK